MNDSRRREIKASLKVVRERLAAAAEASGRGTDALTLVVVTKTWPTTDIEILQSLGVTDIGENKHQEASEKVSALEVLQLRWHFVGRIQSNKASRIAAYADVVHSVDSVRVAQRLNSGAHQHDRTLDCFIQVSLDAPGRHKDRGGVPPSEIDELAYAVETAGGLRLVGVMGVAPLGEDPTPAYDRLAEVSRRLQGIHPHATAVSAGMSDDFEQAVKAGATHVRVGSAILGERQRLG